MQQKQLTTNLNNYNNPPPYVLVNRNTDCDVLNGRLWQIFKTSWYSQSCQM